MNADIANISYLVLALLIFGSAALWARGRAKQVGARGPGVLVSLLIWAGVIALLVVLVRAGEIWNAVLSLFS